MGFRRKYLSADGLHEVVRHSEAEGALLESQALKKKLSPADIARMVLFMATKESHMCTKMELILDAGRV